MQDIKDAIYEHGVAVFRDQEFSPEDHIKFGRRWGGIDVNNYFPLQDDYNEIAVVKKDPDQLDNVAGQTAYSEIKDELAARLIKELKATADPRVVGGGEKFDEYPYLGGGPKHPSWNKRKKPN